MLPESCRRFTVSSRSFSVICSTTTFVTLHMITNETPASAPHQPCISTNVEMSADMDSGPPKQPGSGLSAVLKTLNQNILMMDKDFEAPGPSSDRYRTSSPPKIIHGIIRNSPAALLNTQPTYFSERACATPMIPPSTGDFKSEMRDMEAHIGAYAHPPGETHAEKRHKKALDRAFRMRKERGYRLSSPSNVIVAGDPFHTPVQYVPYLP